MIQVPVRFLSALLLLTAPVFAQDVRAKVQGFVSDSSQAAVAGAKVILTNTATNVTATSQTNQSGQYLFDFVVAGDYTVTVEFQGFRKFIQKNILVQSRADITVDARLEVGAAAESVTVESAPVSVQFNSSTVALTIDKKMTNELPIINRNPFLLAQLNPASVLRSTTEQSPYHHWASTQIDVGGNTSTKNDVVVDGSPNMASEKSAYTPAMDAVQEVSIQQNAVDAEFGHSAGGIIAVQMKSGTNSYHGTAYYLGRNPAINAVADQITRRANLTRNHIYGGTVGSPVIKNRVFNFVSYEAWKSQDPRSVAFTLPTDAERTGDFSKSLNARGGLRAIYNPFTSVLNADGTGSRQPYAGNIIPVSQQDAVGRRVMNDIWKPNLAGTGSDAVNNYRTGFAERVKYWNFSDRADWNISDKLKFFGRYSMFKTYVAQDNYAGSRAFQPNGSERHAWTTVGDLVYTISPNTVFNIRGGYNRVFDSFADTSAQISPSTLTEILGSDWHSTYSKNDPAIYYPGFTVRRGPSATNLGRTGFWYQDPETYNMQSKISKSAGRHYFKVGGEWRSQRVEAVRPRPVSFDIRPELTASTFLNPDLNLSGDAWATLLTGALDNNTLVQSLPIQRHRNAFYSLYFHDDIKLSQRLTVNLGLRYEYESPMIDPQNRLSRFLDLTSPIPELTGANTPVIPAAAAALRTGAPVYNGAWIFTDDNNRGSWNAQKLLLMPRAGLAYKLNDKSSLRVGYARYLVPSTLTDGLDVLGSVFYPGFEATTRGLPLLTGVPQSKLSNPFPGGLVPVSGKSFGRYTDLGGSPIFYNQDFQVGVNDRINFSLQRALPGKMVIDTTYFINFGKNAPVTRNLNQVDPRIGYQRGAATAANVANPFFNKLTAAQMPGQLRTQANVPVSQLLRLYPQYGDIQQRLVGKGHNRYQALQIQVQRPFANGFNMVLGYNYNRERNEEYYDEQDNFTDSLTFFPAVNPRHRLTGATIYQLPFGKDRKFMSNANKFVDGVFGGWSLSGLFSINSGQYLRFGGLIVNGDPSIENPTRDRVFDTTKFARIPAFTRRTNPLQYDGVKSAMFKNIDMTLAKNFSITEKLKFELRMEAYNATNSFNGDLPSTAFGTSAFGSVTAQRPGYLDASSNTVAVSLSSLFVVLTAQDFVSTKSCAVCHSEIAAKQFRSHHAGALSQSADRRWAFGAGAQAVTYVSQIDEDTYLEHGLSLYAKGGLALTPGHRNTAGVKYQTFAPDANLLRCFQCHSTGKLRIDEKRAVQPFEAGVRCESCHGPGSEHAAKPAKANIHKPAQLNEECGQCHRMPPAQGVATNFDNPWNVRHQPVYFSQSACFLKGKASCMTCHDPHEDKAPATAVCGNCHTSPKHTANVSNKTCFECHMPVVKPSPQLGFINHWIGIYKLMGPGANLTRPIQQRPGR